MNLVKIYYVKRNKSRKFVNPIFFKFLIKHKFPSYYL